ncbi:hypothetical protein [Nonomuraea sp. NPDC050310]|uniref:hypothetical protein n=1 Tax=Nonomuraea sp. NPDC050310 TaxID=3154935 RepID=UPI0033E17A8C
MKKLILEVSGVVEAPPAAVLRELNASIPDHGTTERTATGLSVQGGWWYRGEWHAEPYGTGTLVVHRVYNVATVARWGVPLANRLFIGYERTTRESFADGLRKIANRLNTSARLK